MEKLEWWLPCPPGQTQLASGYQVYQTPEGLENSLSNLPALVYQIKIEWNRKKTLKIAWKHAPENE